MTRPCTHKSRLVSSGWYCPLYPLKRTCSASAWMSAKCQKRTSEALQRDACRVALGALPVHRLKACVNALTSW